jgi:hypothetical protein
MTKAAFGDFRDHRSKIAEYSGLPLMNSKSIAEL